MIGRSIAAVASVAALGGPASAADVPAAFLSESRALDCLASAIAHEAGNESEAGQQAVAEVVLNRVAHRAFPKSVCAVVFEGAGRRTGCQFSFTCDGSLRRVLQQRIRDRARRIAAAVLAGEVTATVGDATHYHADYVAPRWAPSLVRIRRLGAHIFYRFPGAGAGSRAAAAAATVGPASVPVVFSPWGLTVGTAGAVATTR